MEKHQKNVITLAKYILTKGVESSLKIQKNLFFMRVEEKRAKKDFGFFKKSNNFQAWIYGPVNVESFYELQRLFNKQEEKECFILANDEVIEIDKLYENWFNKYAVYSATDLINKSHDNISWQNARGDLDKDEPCNNYLIEDETFIQFFK